MGATPNSKVCEVFHSMLSHIGSMLWNKVVDAQPSDRCIDFYRGIFEHPARECPLRCAVTLVWERRFECGPFSRVGRLVLIDIQYQCAHKTIWRITQ